MARWYGCESEVNSGDGVRRRIVIKIFSLVKLVTAFTAPQLPAIDEKDLPVILTNQETPKPGERKN